METLTNGEQCSSLSFVGVGEGEADVSNFFSFPKNIRHRLQMAKRKF
jgi:hypothetical protein